jgi:hypothetical protein
LRLSIRRTHEKKRGKNGKKSKVIADIFGLLLLLHRVLGRSLNVCT